MNHNKKIITTVCSAVAAIAVVAVFTSWYLLKTGCIDKYHPLKKARRGQIRVACVGDSITYGFGIKDQKEKSYPAVLGRLLGDGYAVNNFGFSDRTAGFSANRPYVDEELYRQSLDFMPDIVVIMLGTNDSKPYNWINRESFINDYEKIIGSYLKLRSNPKIFIMIPPTPFPVLGKVRYEIDADVVVNEICPAARQIADEMGFDVIDVNALLKDKPELFVDGLHPNAEGAELIAKLVYKTIINNTK
ncbi:MAG: GDSL-type esterase/lipase family protein [Oscillospiraceae bacterium]|nr:GDSL-type esterase/lipase family protein [Oscillospiraceae bacterium]